MKMSLKALRINKGLTQKAAADEIGVGLATLKNWEAAKTFPNQPQIERICAVYGVTYDCINFLPAC